MSTFKVEVREIDEIRQHSNADRLQLAKVKGMDFQFVSQKDLYTKGSKVVYFPIDSVLPQNLIERFGLVGRLAGKDQNRIKTIRLRGEISQGFVVPVADLQDIIGDPEPMTDVTAILGVEKYDPPPLFTQNGTLVPLPEGLSIYDIEGADRFKEVVDFLITNKIPVWISEKLEGTNFSVTVRKDGTRFVNQRNYSIIESEEEGKSHVFWEVTRKYDLFDLAEQMRDEFGANQASLYGELLGPGIQNNIYKLKEHEVRFFDLKLDNQFASVDDFFKIGPKLIYTGAGLVPTLEMYPIDAFNVMLEDYLAGRTVQEASNGKSALYNTDREGIVIKPMTEMTHPALNNGRLIIKQRSPHYLAKTDF